ncbi:MAG: restriction endonuclease subunit S, partial [Bdellovibrionota bacterium]
MKRWPTKPLGEVLELSRERIEPAEHLDTAFNYVGLESIEGHSGKLLPYQLTLGAEIKSTKNVFHPREILYGKLRPYLNKVYLASAEGICSTDIYVLRPRQGQLHPSFAANYLRSPSVLAIVSNAMAGANLPRIGRDALLTIPVPVPPLAEQERIVKLLDEADELRKLRAQADRRTAALIPSLFHEMFGDPQTSPKRWPSKRLGEAATINPRLQKEKQPTPETEVSFVPMAAVDEVRGVISSSEVRRYSEVAKGYTPFQNGDVLFAKITPCMQNGKSAIAANLVGGLGFGSTEFYILRPTDAVTSEYVFWLIRRPSFRAQAEQTFTGTAGQQRVPTSFLENYPCPIPPLELQKE